ncbi:MULTISPECIES: ABC transporter ATP-binding protein [Achromobacter]|uniref:Putative ABC transporter ATP-binding protein YejF n=1 Tax=Achromobacter piechaudii TaxID=72556 RepID=A0A6S7E0E3_9BURK|nr:dipeptide ABC transporter ATP-binding protein [Achromobacter piechaudii]MPS76773.1 ABC transporter ATP-binding protein [Achromobacter sp.]CAB3887262.1 putative ABC transporter ATP-binding protein YejF [Achromobacter piechaudii]
MSQDTTLLDVRGLDVDIAGEAGMTHAVKRLELAISQRQTFALVGESGCGKSITALALLRLLPDAGRIVGGQIDLDGQDLNRLPESAMRGVRGGRIGIIFQEPSTSLNPVMRVGDQIIETLTAHTPLRGAAARARAIDWLRRVGIPEPERRVDDYPFQFSGGQKQRVMIAIALAAEPLLLIADEPTTALDVTVQAQVLDLLADIQREMGMAVMLITHDLAVVKNVAHHVALMRGGEIVESASAEEFFRAPKHPYARQLFEAIPTFDKRGAPLTEQGRQAIASDGGNRARQREARGAGDVVLDVQDLKVHYPVRKGPLRRVVSWVKAVDGVTFTLRAGETLALLGESGCGKTTTGKALLRLIDGARISGRAMLQGKDLLTADRRTLRDLRQDIQIVFQDPYASLDPRMRVGDILDEGLASLRRSMSAQARAAHAAQLIERVGLPANTLTRYPHEFSGGQRQRIAIARALAVEPKVLICDEPTSALDVSVQAQILDLLRELQDELGIAYLFITHNFGVVEYLADRIAVMDGGRIVELGDADAVLHAPRQDLTRRLLAAVPRLQFGASDKDSPSSPQ